MSAQVKIFRDGNLERMEKEINVFLKNKNLNRDQVTIKQSQSTVPALEIPAIAICTITLLYDEE